MTFINYESFGNTPSGQKKRLTVVPRLECSPGKGLYYHALMDRPDHLNELAINCLLNPGWAETAWSYKETIVERATDVQGWLSKATAQTIDWENVALKFAHKSSQHWSD
jgi:hypothetical protein